MVLDTKFHTVEEDTLEKAILKLLTESETGINEWYFIVKKHIVIGTHISRLNKKRTEQIDMIANNTEYSCMCFDQVDGIVEIKPKKKRATRKKKVKTTETET